MNLQTDVTVRQAGETDAVMLAKLIDIAGEGIPTWLWRCNCTGDQPPLDIGAERARRTSGGFSFCNALVAAVGKDISGMVLSYPIDTATEEDPDKLPAPIAPFVELEKQSEGTWYINALAVFASQQGLGIGSMLLKSAEAAAMQSGYFQTSIQVYAQNKGAVRLYERNGYRAVTRSKVRDHPSHPYYTGDVLLLVKDLGH
jgi:ribosomal protein S18 acetylase RimI-like enzyme